MIRFDMCSDFENQDSGQILDKKIPNIPIDSSQCLVHSRRFARGADNQVQIWTILSDSVVVHSLAVPKRLSQKEDMIFGTD